MKPTPWAMDLSIGIGASGCACARLASDQAASKRVLGSPRYFTNPIEGSLDS